MSLSLKKLAGETVIYGASTMIGRLLNWLLMPFYIRTLSTYEYGVVVNFYGVISVLLVILTYGLETGFFRFAGKAKSYKSVYETLLCLLSFTSFIFLSFGIFFFRNVSVSFYGGQHQYAILLVFFILAIDSFVSLPFAKLRLENKSLKFGIIKLISIGANIFFNLFFLVGVPYFINKGLFQGFLSFIHFEELGKVFFVFLSNGISSLITLFLLMSEIKWHRNYLDFRLIKPVLIYSLPILFVGICGMVTQNIDKILLPSLLGSNGFEQLAIYGANFKIGVLMSLFAQSFRFAFEPYFFKNREHGKEQYAKIMDYFIFFGLTIFLGVNIFLDWINILLTDIYTEGNYIIPIILLALLFYGIYYNLSLWYKLTDKTWIGALLGGVGALISVTLNFVLVPIYGIIGSAIALFFGYFSITLLSWLLGKKFYPVPYKPLRYLFYFVLAGIFFLLDHYTVFEILFFQYLYKGTIFVVFIGSFFVIQKYGQN
ncbi:Membrane protein involved in the export of O-antigen and teichoic acid [Thermophagus xiamenensis]|uniref:Membrane protein involved in the export of O-antigen and teichoic acid n=1 Tax=Thermophagus xiamenensis TaxID=385682 RepID=A0A1I2CY14_9BACT|nr:Membrane protein involved in the export of O-antigen and teichoic acid [Thermophagus xiamenensis]